MPKFSPSLDDVRNNQSSPAIRLATRADISAIFKVRVCVRENHLDEVQLSERGVTRDSVATMLQSPRHRVWVAEDENSVVGFIMADGEAGAITALFVHPNMERRGYGRGLLRIAEEWLFGEGWRCIWLQTAQEAHFRAHGFYRAAGWRLIGPTDHDDVRYEKTAKSADDAC